jgi:hypothetical protein
MTEGSNMLIAQRPSLTEEVVDEFRSRFVIEPLEPGFGYTLGNSLRRTRDRGEERTAQGVAEGVTEARLQRLDHEPGAELVDDLFGQRGTLSDQHVWIRSFFRGRPLFDARRKPRP